MGSKLIRVPFLTRVKVPFKTYDKKVESIGNFPPFLVFYLEP
jgi:hypothetical protein